MKPPDGPTSWVGKGQRVPGGGAGCDGASGSCGQRGRARPAATRSREGTGSSGEFGHREVTGFPAERAPGAEHGCAPVSDTDVNMCGPGVSTRRFYSPRPACCVCTQVMVHTVLMCPAPGVRSHLAHVGPAVTALEPPITRFSPRLLTANEIRTLRGIVLSAERERFT